MESNDLKLLAKVYACVARVEGMKAANMQRMVQNNSMMYSEDHFTEEVQELEILSSRFGELV